jgi:transposase
MLTMYKQITIHTLHKQGVKKSAIARQLGCHRNTVTNILEREHFSESQTRKKQSLFDIYSDKIKELLETEVTRVRIIWRRILRIIWRMQPSLVRLALGLSGQIAHRLHVGAHRSPAG